MLKSLWNSQQHLVSDRFQLIVETKKERRKKYEDYPTWAHNCHPPRISQRIRLKSLIFLLEFISGLVNACKSFKLSIPLVVRLEGTNVQEGKRILDESKLPLIFASDLDEAASKAVRADSSSKQKAFAAW